MKNINKLERIYSDVNIKALKKAELLQNEIKQNIEFNLYDDGFLLI